MIGLLLYWDRVAGNSRARSLFDESLARASRVGGTVRPRAFAVLRLITSSKLVGCRTDKSAGLLRPRRQRPPRRRAAEKRDELAPSHDQLLRGAQCVMAARVVEAVNREAAHALLACCPMSPAAGVGASVMTFPKSNEQDFQRVHRRIPIQAIRNRRSPTFARYRCELGLLALPRKR